ncbi:MAG: nickel insertion protein [Pseudomonadota bacterium]
MPDAIVVIYPRTGLAGDMLVAGLSAAGGLDAGELGEVLSHAGGLLGRCTVEVIDAGSLDGAPARRLDIALEADLPGLGADRARTLLERLVTDLGLDLPRARLARRGLEALLSAEAAAHGGVAHPHLHEAQDILIDLAGAAWCLQRIGIEVIRCGAPVPGGGGTVRCSHGILDVPAPATARLLEEHAIPWAPGPVMTELLTPTGAALLAALAPEWIPIDGLDSMAMDGWGLGTKELPGRPNGVGIAIR